MELIEYHIYISKLYSEKNIGEILASSYILKNILLMFVLYHIKDIF